MYNVATDVKTDQGSPELAKSLRSQMASLVLDPDIRSEVERALRAVHLSTVVHVANFFDDAEDLVIAVPGAPPEQLRRLWFACSHTAEAEAQCRARGFESLEVQFAPSRPLREEELNAASERRVVAAFRWCRTE